jgi:hypothetical protein
MTSAEGSGSFEDCFKKFLQQDGFNYVARDSRGQWSIVEAINLLKRFTEMYLIKNRLLPSVSAFKIITSELRGEGMISLFKKAETESNEVQLTAAEYHAIPSADLQRKYTQNVPPGFRAAVDRLFARGEA